MPINRLTPHIVIAALILALGQSVAWAQDSSWEQYFDSAEQALRDNQPDVASKLLQTALTQAKAFAPGDPRLDKTLKAFADLYYGEGHYQDAYGYYKHLLKCRQDAPEPDPVAIADALSSVGDCANSLAAGQGTHFYADAAALLEKHLNAQDPKIAAMLVELAGSEADNQEYHLAEDHLKTAVAIYEANAPDANPPIREHLIQSLHELANTLSLNDKESEARKVQERIAELK